jgi:Niemann-Pick C1 protein
MQGAKVEVGLDQKIVLPKDSYLIDYFKALESELEVGAPLYFVFRGESTDLSSSSNQRKFCGRFQDCDELSVSRVLEMEYRRNESTVATSSAVWLDDFVLYLNNLGRPCCVKDKNPRTCYIDMPRDESGSVISPEELEDNDDPRSSNHNVSCACHSWRWFNPSARDGYQPIFDNHIGTGLPNGTDLIDSLGNWLSDIPHEKCPTAGKAAYGESILVEDGKIKAFYIRTYHKVLRTQSDFIEGYKDAQRIADLLKEKSLGLPIESEDVYPYSVFYVFFEQYQNIHQLALKLVLFALLAVFVITTIILGSPLTALVICVVVLMMISNLVGIMALWDISLNAISTVNLLIAVGIGVEFCIHVARGSLVDVRDALVEIGSSVFSGITITKLIGITVLAFAKSEVFVVFYFRMYMTIVVLGALHGLVLLPVVLDYLKWKKKID